jgi:hypothetical protein
MAGAAVFLVGSAEALTGSNFNTTNGSLTSLAIHDWNPAGSPAGNIGPIDPINCNTATNCGLDLTGSSADNSFANGPKEDDLAPNVGTGSIPPNKDDLSRFYVNQEKANNKDFLYLAWERTNLLGSAHMDFEFNQSSTNSANGVTKVRSEGDMLVTFDFGGSGVPSLSLSRWLATGNGHTSSQCEVPSDGIPCWSALKDITSAGLADGSVNASAVTDNNPPNNPRTLAGSTSSNGTVSSTFGEAAINLTDSGVFPANVCEHFGSADLKSRSSGQSFTSTLKDFIAPIPVNISNCGEIKIIKHTSPRGTDHDFTFNSPSISGATFSHALDASNNFTLNDKGNTTADNAANTQDITNVPAGSYTFTEANATGWDLTGLTCDAPSTSSATTDKTARTAAITLAAGDTVTCTYTNTPRGTIIIKKVTVPALSNTGPNFTFNPTGFNSGTSFTLKGGTQSTFSNLAPGSGGTYKVTESNPASLGYDLTSATCDNSDDPTTSITVTAGGTTTCTFTNTLRLGAIQVTKQSSKGGENPLLLAGAKFVVKDGQGNVVTGGNLTTNSNGTACVGNLPWAGTGTNYTVTETQAPSGYSIDNALPVTVTVDHNATCGGTGVNTPDATTFTDTPLTDLVVTATSEAAGGTKSSIQCTDSGSNDIGHSTGFPGFVDPASVNVTGLKPGTYTCVVVIDP